MTKSIHVDYSFRAGLAYKPAEIEFVWLDDIGMSGVVVNLQVLKDAERKLTEAHTLLKDCREHVVLTAAVDSEASKLYARITDLIGD